MATANYLTAARKANTKGTLLLEIDLIGDGSNYASSKTIYLSDRYITVDSVLYEGLVFDFGGLDISSQANEGISTINDFTIVLVNNRLRFMSSENKFSDLFDEYFFQGSVCRVYQWFEELSSKSDALLLFKGIAKQPSFNESEVEFTIEESLNELVDIPRKIITLNDFSNAPDESINNPIPIVYGDDWEFNEIKSESANVTPCVFTDDNLKTFYISGHEIIPTNLDAETICIYLEDSRRYGTIRADNKSYTNDANGGRITLNDDISYSIQAIPKVKGSQYDSVVSDYSNIMDADNSTTQQFTAGENVYFKLDKWPSKDIPLEIGTIQLVIGVTAISGSSPYGVMQYYNQNYDAGVGGFSSGGQNITGTGIVTYTIINDRSAHGVRDDQGDQDDAWLLSELADYEFGFTVGAGDTVTVSYIYLNVTRIPFVYSKLPVVTYRAKKYGLI